MAVAKPFWLNDGDLDSYILAPDSMRCGKTHALTREGRSGLDRGSPKWCPSAAMADAARAQPDMALFQLPQPTSPVNIFMEASRGADKSRT
jgi:hypothetical protein